jgi:hypothetical protein
MSLGRDYDRDTPRPQHPCEVTSDRLGQVRIAVVEQNRMLTGADPNLC